MFQNVNAKAHKLGQRSRTKNSCQGVHTEGHLTAKEKMQYLSRKPAQTLKKTGFPQTKKFKGRLHKNSTNERKQKRKQQTNTRNTNKAENPEKRKKENTETTGGAGDKEIKHKAKKEGKQNYFKTGNLCTGENYVSW